MSLGLSLYMIYVCIDLLLLLCRYVFRYFKGSYALSCFISSSVIYVWLSVFLDVCLHCVFVYVSLVVSLVRSLFSSFVLYVVVVFVL